VIQPSRPVRSWPRIRPWNRLSKSRATPRSGTALPITARILVAVSDG
jgi:hypothetical protein